MAAIDQLRTYRSNPNVQKFLNMLSAAEGTMTHGYATAFGGGRIADLSHHPKKSSQFKETTGKTNITSAAGRYQFIGKTWDSLQRKLGLPDFGAESQDLAAIELLRENGALPYILKGDMRTAVQKAGGTWASLPTSKAPQHTRSWAFINAQLGMPAGLPTVPSQPTPSVSADTFLKLASTLSDLAKTSQTPSPDAAPVVDPAVGEDEKIDVVADPANTYLNFKTPDLSPDVKPLELNIDNSINIDPETEALGLRVGELQRRLETAKYVNLQNDAVQKMFGDTDPNPSLGALPEGVAKYLNTLIGKA